MQAQKRRISLRGLALLAVVLACATMACGGAAGPSIQVFEATPSTLEVGEKATLKIQFSGGGGTVAPAPGPVSSGQAVEVAPASTTVYTLDVGGTRAQATVTVNPGLRLRVEGLPTGVAADIRITGPDGFDQKLTGDQVFPKLKPGRYTVATAAVQDGAGVMRQPLRLLQTVDLTTTGAEIKVAYPSPTLRVELPNKGSLDFVFIPPGSFTMGREPRATDASNGVRPYPVHVVTLAKGFYMGKFPVTWGQWLALRPEDIQWGWFKGHDPETPIFYTSYFDIKRDFLPSLSKTATDLKFRLPNEAEWEYALRAGSTTTYFWGDDYERLSEFAWTGDELQASPILPKVGGKRPNPWGLHDMFTMATWLEDLVHVDYQGAPTDGSPWLDNPVELAPMIRGASAFSRKFDYGGIPNEIFESAFRFGPAAANASLVTLGFRLVLEVKD